MPQQIARGYGPQEVPEAFAAQLRELQQRNSPALNKILVVARRMNWRTSTLANTLGISVAAASKRMERATPASWEINMREVARDCLRDYRDMLDEIREQDSEEITEQHLSDTAEDLEYLVEVRIGELVTREDVLSKSDQAQTELWRQSATLRGMLTPAARNVSRKVGTLARRLSRADSYQPGDPPVLPGSEDSDAMWLRHLQQAVVSSRGSMVDVPEIGGPNAGLREQIVDGLDDLLARLRADTIDVDEAEMATLVIGERLRLMRLTMPKEVPDRARIARRIITVSNRLRLAREYSGGPVVVEGVEIPPPPRVQTMLHGQHLPQETIDRLRGLQTIASQVNGGTPRNSEAWRASVKLSEELDRLTEPADPDAPRYTAYYLAKVIGITHRAVITRLQRYRRAQGRSSTATVRAAKRAGRAA